LEKNSGFAQTTLDCLPFHIAIVNESGIITYVNRAWKTFAASNGAPQLQNCGVGSNYLEVCRSAVAQEAFLASEATAGLQCVLRGEKALFELEYPCDSPAAQRWFLMTVSRLDETEGRRGGAVIVHQNVTARKLATEERERSQHDVEHQREQQQELNNLDHLRQSPRTVVASRMFGDAPLRETYTADMAGLTVLYAELLEKAVEERTYRTERTTGGRLRQMASELGSLRARPRDVVEIHRLALQPLVSEENPRKAKVYLEEGRVLLVELLGYLADHYRLLSLRS
jgi:hypothetical protein